MDSAPIQASWAIERALPRRLLVIGDLNGSATALERLLVAARLMTRGGRWCGRDAVVVQLGDVPNRGPEPRRAMDLLMRLLPDARAQGGDVIGLLGNHELLATVGHEGYLQPEEYLEFATAEEVDHHALERSRFVQRFLASARGGPIVPPMGAAVRAFDEQNAPGREAYRQAMGPDGRYGRWIRSLPVAVRLGPILCVHGGLTPRWAHEGLEGLECLRRAAWATEPTSFQTVDPFSLLRDPTGPLWTRALALAPGARLASDLDVVLRAIGVRHVFVGHTRTDSCSGGRVGEPFVRARGAVVLCDVGLGDPGHEGAGLLVERGAIDVLTGAGQRRRLLKLRTRPLGPRRKRPARRPSLAVTAPSPAADRVP